MLINILYLIIGIAVTLIWTKVVKPKTPLNYQKIVKDKFWLILTGLTIVGVAYLYFYLPQVFKWLAVDIWGVPASSVGEDKKTVALQLTDLGPLGDIYGSLNTLFTSATLAFVVYATLLQREANKDARDAMSNQLQQARDATAKQLRQARQALKQQLDQAREATEQQITNAKELANTQLEHARESTERQLALTQVTHDAQIKESQHAVFSNAFYTLLNYKQSNLNSLRINSEKGEFYPEEIFLKMSMEFLALLDKEWKSVNDIPYVEIERKYDEISKKITGSEYVGIQLTPYFMLYQNLFDLLKKANLDENSHNFYRAVIMNSMTIHEKYHLIWLSANCLELSNMIKDNEILNDMSDSMTYPFILTIFK